MTEQVHVAIKSGVFPRHLGSAAASALDAATAMGVIISTALDGVRTDDRLGESHHLRAVRVALGLAKRIRRMTCAPPHSGVNADALHVR